MNCLVNNYINLTNTDFIGILSPELENEIITYQNNFLMYHVNPDKLKDILEEKIIIYIDSMYSKLNIKDVEINYYLENINNCSIIKFQEVIKFLEINHIISMMDHGSKNKIIYKYFLDFENH